MSKPNSKTLTVAAALLIVLALLILASPLLDRSMGLRGRTGAAPQFSAPANGLSQTSPDFQNDQGFPAPGNAPSGGTQGQTNPNFPNRQFTGQMPRNIFRFGFLSGLSGTIVYTIALLLSIVAAAGMFMNKAWGKILGIILAVLYAALALLNILPTLFFSAILRFSNPWNIALNILHLVLAIAVIVLASIPAKRLITPPPASTEPAPPTASA